MSLADAITKISSLGGKAAGHLIRPQDWNTLIEALSEFGGTLTNHEQELGDLGQRVTDLETQLNAATSQLQTLTTKVTTLEPLLDSYRVSLSTTRQFYATGEVCEITAKVTNLQGQPLAAPFPWVDFVASWGRLRAKAGFVSRAGVGDNSLSVQVNAQGIAQVLLRTEHVEGFTELEETQINQLMNIQVPSQNKTIAQTLLAASAPSDPGAKAAYQILHAEYERKDSVALRSFADVYYVRTPEWGSPAIIPNYWIQWRDYRSTVIALAKPDADPTTPDGARGSASIQVTFRDWLWSWAWNYLDDVQVLSQDLTAKYTPLFQQPDVPIKAKDLVKKDLVDRGVLGRIKYYQAAERTLELINPGSQLDQQRAKQQVQEAISAQKSTETHYASKATEEPAIFNVHMSQKAATDSVNQQVQGVAQKVTATEALQTQVISLEARMQSTEKAAQNINGSLSLINDNVRAINPLDENSLKANVLKISSEIAALKSRLG